MGVKLKRLDPDRRRRRVQLIAELTGTKAVRGRVQPRRRQLDHIRELIVTRRGLAG
jgi:hypothetical protein